MIMIHDPRLLIKLIIRMIVRKLGVKHAAMLLYDHERNVYILSISRGVTGIKIPPGFTRFSQENPIIKLFTSKKYRPLTIDRSAIVSNDINRMIWREGVIVNGAANEVRELLHSVDEQMQMLNTVVCVPAYYRDKLMAVLLLGEKYDETRFEQEELDFFAALASDAAMAIRNAQLFADLKREADRNKQLFIQTITVLGATIEAKDSYTHGHTERVTKYAVAIARQMTENGSIQFTEEFFENLYIAGMLHDIGKIGVSEAILNKTGKLTDNEYINMKLHTNRGAEIVKPLCLPDEIVNGIRHHHERYDGRGYPDGLQGENIPISAAIIAVADAFDAMVSDRPYRKGLLKEDAIEEIRKNTGTQFNPLPAKALIELYNKKMV
jgi:putative nucleotidyltransferase with HDIG domain